MEHAIRKIVKDKEIYKWLCTDGVYTSCHDLISRILQFDVDGDQLNVVVEPVVLRVAKRNVEKFNIIPLFYDANKAPSEMITKESLFNGLLRAHKFSNIGEISNMLTRLWNRDKPDFMAAALLTYLNNLRIDGAKTGAVNEYTNYPEVAKRINRATGGANGRMPFFFQFSKNGRAEGKRKRKWAAPNNSTMNRICAAFDDIGNISMKFANVPPFNWEMLMPETDKLCGYIDMDIVTDFVVLSNLKLSIIISNSEDPMVDNDNKSRTAMVEEKLQKTLIRKYGSLEYCYPHICKYLFAGENANKASHKQTFWKIFGDIAVENIRTNMVDYKTCASCKMKYPSWVKEHECPKDQKGLPSCIECGKLYERTNSRNRRCPECQTHFRHDQKLLSKERTKLRKIEESKIKCGYLQLRSLRMW